MTNFYPPILASTQKAFLYSDSILRVDFSISDLMDASRIGHIDIKVLRQRDNSSVVSRVKYPDGIIYKTYTPSTSINISIEDLNIPSWEEGELYKIQLRFGYGDLWGDDLSDFSAWRTEQINKGYFGEWSNVMLALAITTPKLNAYVTTINTLTPTFFGSCESETDPEEFYKFIIYHQVGSTLVEIDNSDWLKSTNDVDHWRSKFTLETEVPYIIKYFIKTRNGYESDPFSQQVTLIITNLNKLSGVNIAAAASNEDGYNEISITLDEGVTLNGNYVISRSLDGKYWEDLKFYLLENFDNTLTYRDYCIESGVNYKYAFQYENSNHIRTERIETNYVKSMFEYSYIYANGVQLRLELNNTMNSFKNTVLATKQDTIGSKYPTISRNGYAYYSEFPINGLISLAIDDSRTFLTEGEDGLYYLNNKILSSDLFANNEERIENGGSRYLGVDYHINTNLSHENIYIERKFREAVESFLNNGEYKLFKSPTEGTMIVNLINVTLSPNQTTGRMIQSFSSTAYEVMDFTIDNLNLAKLISTGEWEEQSSDKIYKDFGQVVVRDGASSILTQIKAEIEEDYPTRIFQDLIEFQVEASDVQPIVNLVLQTEEGNQQIFIQPQRIYTVNDLTSSDIIDIEASSSMIFNYKYTYTLESSEEEKQIISVALKDILYPSIVNTPRDSIFEAISSLLVEQLSYEFSETIYDSGEGYYTNADNTLKIWYLGPEQISVEAPSNTQLVARVEGNDTVINLGDRVIKFFPRRDHIDNLSFLNGAPSSGTIIDSKINVVYEVLASEG